MIKRRQTPPTAYRVLMLLENASFPLDSRVRQEARSLLDAGYQVTVICPAARGQRCAESCGGVRVYRFPSPPAANSLLGYLWEYGYSMIATLAVSLFVLLSKGFDVIHAHNPPDGFAFIAAIYKLLGKRFVFDLHDLCPELYYARFPGRGRRLVHDALVVMERFSCSLADHVIVTNDSYRLVAIQRGKVAPQRITVVRNGPDLSRLTPLAPDPLLRRAGKATIGYVGVIGWQDGVDSLLRSLHHLVHEMQRTDLFCVLVGAGDAWNEAKLLAERFELSEYVHFSGWVDAEHVARYISSLDICLAPEPSNPYNDRSTVIKLMEYMALGKPTVAFDLPEHRVTAGDAAVYARANDEVEFAGKIAGLMDDQPKREAMGRYARRRVETELAWCHQQQALVDAYASLRSAAAASP